MKGITIKLQESTLETLAAEAHASGQSVAAVMRGRLAASAGTVGRSVHARAADLAGVLAGGRRAAANPRRKFRRG